MIKITVKHGDIIVDGATYTADNDQLQRALELLNPLHGYSDKDGNPEPYIVSRINEYFGKAIKGGPGSGNFGHAGRPGKRGGSSSGSLYGAEVDRIFKSISNRVKELETKTKRAEDESKPIDDKQYALFKKSYDTYLGMEKGPEAEQYMLDYEKENERLQAQVDAIYEKHGALHQHAFQKVVLDMVKEQIRNPSNIEYEIGHVYNGDIYPDKVTEFSDKVKEGVDLVNSVLDSSIKTTTNGNPVTISQSMERSRARGMFNLISINQDSILDSTQSTVVHEMGHIIEYHNPNIKKAAQDFLNRRTQGNDNERFVDNYPKSGFDDNEVYKDGGFFHPYVGKLYKNGETEIVAMGLEQLTSKAYDFYTQDPDHFQFMLGVLTGNI